MPSGLPAQKQSTVVQPGTGVPLAPAAAAAAAAPGPSVALPASVDVVLTAAGSVIQLPLLGTNTVPGAQKRMVAAAKPGAHSR